MRYLKENTATRVTVGPFLDKTDGITPEIALTVTSELLTFVVDDAGVPTLVIDAAPTASGGSNDMVHITSDAAGMYDLELTAAQTNYTGRAILALTDSATHLPVWHEFQIVSANVYDSLFTDGDVLDVSVTQVIGETVTTSGTAGYMDVNVVEWNSAAAPTIATQSNIGDEVDTRLAGMNLDHLMSVAVTGADVTDNSVVAKLVSKSATADWDDFVNTTDSLQAQKDAGVTLIGGQTVSASAPITVPGVIASTTNITGGTITTATNLTNLPTIPANWLTNAGTAADFFTSIEAEVDDALVARGLDGTDAVADSIYTAVVTNAAGADVAADIIAMKAETALIVADTNELQTDWADAGRLDAILDTAAAGGGGGGITPLLSGALQSATSTTAVLAAATTLADDVLNDTTIINIITGTGAGQSRLITDWDSATDTATVDAWTTTPAASDTYEVVGSGSANLDVTVTAASSTISAIAVAPSRTFYVGREGYRAQNIINVKENFVGTLAMMIDLNDGTVIDTDAVHTATITGAASVTPTTVAVSAAGDAIHVTVPALTTTGTYTVLVTALTLDAQTIPLTGTLVVN